MDIVKYERLRSISNVGTLYLRGSMFDLEGIKRSQDIEDELNWFVRFVQDKYQWSKQDRDQWLIKIEI